ncbi:DUF2278 family protein [Stigmatella hybrida]|uniref:DUF2278 family protein n=1 Tax=Stigmatella hybrida TaxID=394097 RepID=UPI001CDA8FBB|nr:DUF2278 family protein [Stigmatella hybrida]
MSSHYTYSLAIGNVVEAFSPPEIDVAGGVINDRQPGDTSGARSNSEHFNLSLDVGQPRTIQCNINIRSKLGDPNLRYLRLDPLTDESVLKLIRNTSKSFTPLDQGVCFSDLFDLNQMQLLDESAPSDSPGEVSLVEMVEALIQSAKVGGNGTLYVFGRGYSDPDGTAGIDEVHMTQGVTHPSRYQDGALIVSNGDGTYSGLFIAFDSQLSQAGGTH